VCIEAIKDIKAGDELLIPYTPLYWTTFENEDEMLKVLRLYLDGLRHTDKKRYEFLINFLNKNERIVNGV
jgi:SET domain-containing protein